MKKDNFFRVDIGEDDFCNIGKYASKLTNYEEDVKKLIKNLPVEDTALVRRQVELSLYARANKLKKIYSLTEDEVLTQDAINSVFPLKKDGHWQCYGYKLNKKHFEASVFYHKHNLRKAFPAHVLEKIRKKDIIDVGGFIGDSAIIFEKEFCDANIYCFEPVKRNFNAISKNAELNGCKRIVPINKGLGDKKETQGISHTSGSGASIKFHEPCKEKIEIITLDDFVRENELFYNMDIGFIKVDTEGYEQPFLRGAKETICSQKPALLISIYHSGDDYFNIKPLIESWNLGYKMRILKGTDFTLTCETCLYCYMD